MKPNIELLRTMLASGCMFVLGAFHGDRIIGYSSATLGAHIYSTEIFCCASDALFVLPEYRKTSAGARLIVATERVAADRGANRMLWHTRAGTSLAAVLEKRGYEPADTVVMKRI
jgi:GNAT superfamily N-acetyltransferase